MKTLSKTLSIPVLAATLALASFSALAPEASPARFGNDPFIGEVALFAGNFPPRGWAFCDGQLLSIPQNSALFSILGTTYGGDGRSTFALPDLRGRVAVHPGTGPGLTTRKLGQRLGSEATHITIAQMPTHSHNLRAFSKAGTNDSPAGDVLANAGTRFYSPETPNVDMNGTAISNAGGGQSLSLLQPSLGLNYIIALQGTFPARQ
ncbi:MAG: tail Collar domain-containing protein [Planctomycetota bacterium]|nr:MAG: tail Collar domain-containing protein [Planctomycetota bacterium]